MRKIIPMLALALCAPAVAIAQERIPTELYRSVMPDGSVRYGESPDPGARQVRKLQTVPSTTGTIVVTPDEKGRGMGVASPGGVTVIPVPKGPVHTPAEQGRLQSGPYQLPNR